MEPVPAPPSAPPAAAPAASASPLREAYAVARVHIVGVAMGATLVFAWLITGRRPWALALATGIDWFLVNLLNRVTDVAEDAKNGVPGTGLVARHRRAISLGGLALFAGSLAVSHLLAPALTPWRLAVQAVGVAYNWRVLPGPRRWRLKDAIGLKNASSAGIFVLTGFAYPLAVHPRTMPWPGVAALVLFFLLYEMTYEILYDLRDVEGDRAEGVPTLPVVLGARAAWRVVDALNLASAAVLLAAFFAGALGVREAQLMVAPFLQTLFFRRRRGRGPDARDCIRATHATTALLLFYLAGTAAWERLGLPENLWFGAPRR